MRSKAELDAIKEFVNSTYTNFGNSIRVVLNKPYDKNNPALGYCYKYQDKVINSYGGVEMFTMYNVVCSTIGIPRTDYRVLLHEYGHIYLSHLDGIHEDLDRQICTVFRDYREELIEELNESLGIDFADKLIERVIDDKSLNHSLHNIAMDMEVNSKILSSDDIKEMEGDITSIMPKPKGLEAVEEFINDPDNGATKEEKKAAETVADIMRNQAMIKLILPERYHFKDGTPFPDDATYPEYLIMIIKNLDQFVKMMVSIQLGGNGDTSDITKEDVQNALNGKGGDKGQGQDGEGKGNADMQSLSDFMDSMGMSASGDNRPDETKEKGSGGKGKDSSSSEDLSNVGGKAGNGKSRSKNPWKDDSYSEEADGGKSDHNTPQREEADEKRDLGEIRAGGGVGCGTGGCGAIRTVTTDVDEVDMAIEKAILEFKNKVIKRELRKDPVWYWNRGINRTVLAPAYRNQVTLTTEPKIVYLIDVSGSMATSLVDRILKTIANKMKTLGTGRGLKYDIISWSTQLEEHIKDIDPRKSIPKISCGGGTRMAKGIKYFAENYNKDAVLILISDFEDDLDDWQREESKLSGYTLYGFNYGTYDYHDAVSFKNMKVKNFNEKGGGYW